MSLKTNIINCASSLAGLSLKTFKPAHLTIVTYHSVRPLPQDYLFDEGVVSTTPEAFEEEVKFFKGHFRIITFMELKAILGRGPELPAGLLIMTFDDGYADNYTQVFPILKKYGVPATVFLSVNHIESGKPYWWNEVVYYLKLLGKREMDIKQFLRELKAVSDKERIMRIKDLSKKILDQSPLSARQSLTWEQIKEMHSHGIEFGSHTMTHPILAHVETDQELDYEIRESKRILKEKLREEIVAFSYPVGGRTAFNERVKQKVKDAGYDFAVSYMHGVNNFNDPSLDRFELKRLDMDKENVERVKVKLAWPGLFKR